MIGNSCVPRLGDLSGRCSSCALGWSACLGKLFSLEAFNIVTEQALTWSWSDSAQGLGLVLVASASFSTLVSLVTARGSLVEKPRAGFDVEASESEMATSGTASLSMGL